MAQAPEEALPVTHQREQADDASERPEASSSLPKCFLIVHSVSKRQNIGNLLRSATAFGVSEVIA